MSKQIKLQEDAAWEEYIVSAVGSLIEDIGKEDLHADGELTKEYLGMLALYAVRREMLASPDDEMLKKIYNGFDTGIMSDRLINRLVKAVLMPVSGGGAALLNNRSALYCLMGGIVRRADKLDPKAYEELRLRDAREEFIRALAYLGYRPRGIQIDRFLEAMEGRSWHELTDEAQKRAKENGKAGRIDTPEAWRDLRRRFGGKILGIDRKYINIHPNGFSVRVSMRSDPIESRRLFVEEHRDEILAWCMEVLKNGQLGIMKKVSDLSYYAPSEIIVLQSGEIEIFFDVKKVMCDKTAGSKGSETGNV